jgi:LmbE family N-acetylglucosaminyl deacetylase
VILALSPHLDDVVFSCGGRLWGEAKAKEGLPGQQAGGGARVECLTIFTKSVSELSHFALACRLDKGLDGEIDYMALRRAEDREACRILGIEPVHWDYAEAPHRGYVSAPDLFAGIHADDPLDTEALRERLAGHIAAGRFTEVLYPFGAGNHVDHLQLIRAVKAIRPDFPHIRFRQYYDMPYAVKFRERYPELGTTVPGYRLSDEAFANKLAACRAYASQLGFQFGGAERVGNVLGRGEYFTADFGDVRR